jgi:outer membrane protein assembly factor BamB
MNARPGLLVGGLLLATLIGSAAPVPPEPPQSPGRNPVNLTERNIPTRWSVEPGQEKNLLWTAALGDVAYGSGPVVAEGKVFVGTNNRKPRDPAIKGNHGVLMCFDAKTGAFLWQIAHKNLDTTDFPARCGTFSGHLASIPVVENGKVYYVSNRGELVCASTDRGKILWSLDMIKDLGVFPGGIFGGMANGSPLILDELVVVSTSLGIDETTAKVKDVKAPSLVAVNKTTGKLVWQDASHGQDILDGEWSSPAAARVDGKWQVIHGGGDGWLRGFDAKTGTLLWKFDCNPKGTVFDGRRQDSKNLIVATPVVVDGKVYVGVGRDPEAGDGIGHLWCVDITKKPTNAALDLSPVDNNFDPKSPKNAGSGLVWHYGGEFKPRPAGVYRDWHFGRIVSSVAVHDGIVYASEVGGYLQALDARTGEKLWEEDLRAETWCSPYYVDGKVFLGTSDGDVCVFRAGRVRERLATNDMDQPVRLPPVAAGGILYISSGSHLFAIQGK